MQQSKHDVILPHIGQLGCRVLKIASFCPYSWIMMQYHMI